MRIAAGPSVIRAVVIYLLLSPLCTGADARRQDTPRHLLSRNPGAQRLNGVAILAAGSSYFVTNGNGTWTYSYYANNGNLNGNNQGDYYYTDQNLAFRSAVSDYTDPFGAPGRFSLSTSTVIGASIEAPASLFQSGVTSVTFLTSRTGVAVGAFNSYQGDAAKNSATILVTYDGADTWSAATGVPTQSSVASAAVIGDWAASPPWPTLTAGDLCSVHFATAKLGWAVGGNAVSFATTVSSWDTPSLGTVPASSGERTPMAVVLISSNGGSVWKGVPVHPTLSAARTAWLTSDNVAVKRIYAATIPGILFGVASDGSGRHVFAVGSPGSRFSASATADVKVETVGTAVLGLFVRFTPTILYSGNSGVSWVSREAPALWGGTAYTLFGVAVPRPTTAIAVGGSPVLAFGAGSAGAIVYSTSGGLSWAQSVYPGSTNPNVPCLVSVAVQPTKAHAAAMPVWAVGYATLTDFAFSSLGVGLALGPGSVDFYPKSAQLGFVAADTIVDSSVARVKGSVYTVLMSMDGGKTFVAAPEASFPGSFVQKSFAHTSASDLLTPNHVYGVTWDNGNHGWLYGYGFILSTRNGGASWVDESPADVSNLNQGTAKVLSIANVPTLSG